MTVPLYLALSVAGGFGAVCRFLLDEFIRARTPPSLPWGTIIINLTGSFTLGLATGLLMAQSIPQPMHLVVGAGFLGGYTTFSTASFETIRLMQRRRFAAAAVNGFGVLTSAVLVAGAGLWIGV